MWIDGSRISCFSTREIKKKCNEENEIEKRKERKGEEIRKRDGKFG